MRPAPSDYPSFFAGYVSLVSEEDILPTIETQFSETKLLLASVDEEKGAYRYAPGKWSVKGVLGHMIDAERIFGYRALCIARGETRPLPGFDEGTYAQNAGFDDWRLSDLEESYALARGSNLVLFRNFPEEAWERRGIANEHPMGVRAIAYVMVGHERHHLNVLRERYRIGQSAT